MPGQFSAFAAIPVLTADVIDAYWQYVHAAFVVDGCTPGTAYAATTTAGDAVPSATADANGRAVFRWVPTRRGTITAVGSDGSTATVDYVGVKFSVEAFPLS